MAVREFLKKKIPTQYYVGHGHIVDQNLNQSNQFDVIIANNSTSPVLFTAKNGTEYFPFESVYAIGEIKSTFYPHKNYIQDFKAKTKKLNEVLSRQKTPSNQITESVSFSSTDGTVQISSNDPRPYKNPLFKFIFCIDSSQLNWNNLKQELNALNISEAPNIIFFLDRGIVAKTKLKFKPHADLTNKEIQELISNPDPTKLANQLENQLPNLFPEFLPEIELPSYTWALYNFNQSNVGGATLAYLIWALNDHLRICLLQRPNLTAYHRKLFSFESAYY